MANNLTDVAENRVLDWITGNTVTEPVAPLMLRLMTVAGSESTGGTEVTGGSYAADSVSCAAASGGTTTNTDEPSYLAMPACTVVAVEVWDSAGTPVRWMHGTLTTSRVFLAGDDGSFSPGSLVLTAG